MTKTTKNIPKDFSKQNKTKKIRYIMKKIDYKLEGNELILRKDCPIGLKSFQKKYL
jgi:hypothetical protein